MKNKEGVKSIHLLGCLCGLVVAIILSSMINYYFLDYHFEKNYEVNIKFINSDYDIPILYHEEKACGESYIVKREKITKGMVILDSIRTYKNFIRVNRMCSEKRNDGEIFFKNGCIAVAVFYPKESINAPYESYISSQGIYIDDEKKNMIISIGSAPITNSKQIKIYNKHKMLCTICFIKKSEFDKLDNLYVYYMNKYVNTEDISA